LAFASEQGVPFSAYESSSLALLLHRVENRFFTALSVLVEVTRNMGIRYLHTWSHHLSFFPQKTVLIYYEKSHLPETTLAISVHLLPRTF
jgi:hypothetical protein